MNKNDVLLVVIIVGVAAVAFLRRNVFKHLKAQHPAVYNEYSSSVGGAKFVFGRKDRELNDATLSAKVVQQLTATAVFFALIVLLNIF